MTSARQERDFKDYIAQLVEVTMPTGTLQEAIDWIGNELEPNDVFSTSQLEEWAERNGYTK